MKVDINNDGFTRAIESGPGDWVVLVEIKSRGKNFKNRAMVACGLTTRSFQESPTVREEVSQK